MLVRFPLNQRVCEDVERVLRNFPKTVDEMVVSGVCFHGEYIRKLKFFVLFFSELYLFIIFFIEITLEISVRPRKLGMS